jgi:CO/xanthine dehydrogenase Mo-binding subunit
MLFQVCKVARPSPSGRAVGAEGVAELLAVVVADHVVQEDDAAEPRPADAPRLDLGVDPAVGPVAVRAEQDRDPAAGLGRPVQVAAEEKPGSVSSTTFSIV